MSGNGHATRMRYGALGVWDARYRRKISGRKITPATPEQWAEHERALAMLEELRKSPYFEDGGPEIGATVDPPRDRIEYTYSETEDEWLERCAAITGPPQPDESLAGAFKSMQNRINRALGEAFDQMGGETTNADTDL